MEGFLMPHPPIIIPEVGKGEENKVIKTLKACKKVGKLINKINPETIIVISPHGTIFRDAMSIISSDEIRGDLFRFNTDEVNLKYNIDTDLVREIKNFSDEMDIHLALINEGTAVEYGITLELDHGGIVPLYYVNKNSKYKIIHITYSMLSPIDHLKFGNCIRKAVEKINKNVVFIASGDLSHRLTKDGPYEYSESGKIFDTKLIEILLKGNMKKLFNIEKTLINEAGECALRSLYILAGFLNSEFIVSDLYSYEGNLGVGYAIMNFKEGRGDLLCSINNIREKEHNRRLKEGSIYTRIARKSLDYYFRFGKILEIKDIEDIGELKEKKGGVFCFIENKWRT